MILDYDLELDVPFAQKDDAKRAGVKPKIENNKFKCWCAPRGVDVTAFERWWPASFRNQLQPQDPAQIKSYSLAQIMKGVQKSIQQGIPNAVWIKAEITGVTGASHKYYEVVDYESASTGAPIKGRAVLFNSQIGLLRKFEEETGMTLAQGMKIMFQAYVEFTGEYGLSLRIVDLNSQFVLGQAELNLKAIRSQLKKDGLIDNNKRLPQPQEFTRVAVIAPQGAAGLSDFMTQASVLEFHSLCEFAHFPATFQGNNAANSIIGAFTQVYEKMQSGIQFDAIVVIRGGGDKAGLYSLNEYSIARTLCLMPIPVIVGIGHEPDNTILDELACVRLPTPSLVVAHISSRIFSNMKEMASLHQELKALTAQKCNMAKQAVKNVETILKEEALRIVGDAKRELELNSQAMKDSSRHVLKLARNEVSLAENQIREQSKLVISEAKQEVRLLTQDILYNDPQKIIDRGYTVVRDSQGKVTGSGEALRSPGTEISIQFKDAVINAVTK